jgi:hypothetical protein
VPDAGALLALPILANAKADSDGEKSCIGVVMAVRAKGSPPFSRRDCMAGYRLCEFTASVLR